MCSKRRLRIPNDVGRIAKGLEVFVVFIAKHSESVIELCGGNRVLKFNLGVIHSAVFVLSEKLLSNF